MKMMHNSRVACLAALGASLALVACGSADSGGDGDGGAESITFAYQPAVVAPIGLVKANGWIEEASGTQVDWANFASGGDVNIGFVSGRVDMGLIGLPPFISGLSEGNEYTVVSLLNIPNENSGLITREGVIDSFDDLRGQTVGVPLGSGADYMLQGALTENGLTSDDITRLNMEPGQIVAAWESGQIDATYIWDPVVHELLDKGGQFLTSDGELAESGYFAGDVLFVANDFLEEHPDSVQVVVNQYMRAIHAVEEGSDETLDAYAGEYELSRDTLEQVGLPPIVEFPDAAEQLTDTWFGSGQAQQGFAEVANFLEANDLISKPVTEEEVSAAVDITFLENATD